MSTDRESDLPTQSHEQWPVCPTCGSRTLIEPSYDDRSFCTSCEVDVQMTRIESSFAAKPVQATQCRKCGGCPDVRAYTAQSSHACGGYLGADNCNKSCARRCTCSESELPETCSICGNAACEGSTRPNWREEKCGTHGCTCRRADGRPYCMRHQLQDEARRAEPGTEGKLPARPWTPGPWCVQIHSDHTGAVWTGTDPETHGNPLCAVHPHRGGVGATDWRAGSAYMRRIDANLIALAPEMAEAMLAWAHWLELDATFDHEAVMRPVLDKLRAIGGTR